MKLNKNKIITNILISILSLPVVLFGTIGIVQSINYIKNFNEKIIGLSSFLIMFAFIYFMIHKIRNE